MSVGGGEEEVKMTHFLPRPREISLSLIYCNDNQGFLSLISQHQSVGYIDEGGNRGFVGGGDKERRA